MGLPQGAIMRDKTKSTLIDILGNLAKGAIASGKKSKRKPSQGDSGLAGMPQKQGCQTPCGRKKK